MWCLLLTTRSGNSASGSAGAAVVPRGGQARRCDSVARLIRSATFWVSDSWRPEIGPCSALCASFMQMRCGSLNETMVHQLHLRWLMGRGAPPQTQLGIVEGRRTSCLEVVSSLRLKRLHPAYAGSWRRFCR